MFLSFLAVEKPKPSGIDCTERLLVPGEGLFSIGDGLSGFNTLKLERLYSDENLAMVPAAIIAVDHLLRAVFCLIIASEPLLGFIRLLGSFLALDCLLPMGFSSGVLSFAEERNECVVC